MRKLVIGFGIAALFFFVGRSRPTVVNTAAQEQLAQQPIEDSQTADATAETKATTAATATSPATADPIEALPQTLKQRLLTQVDSELFETLYSDEFKTNWQASLPTIRQRLFSPLPKIRADVDTHEKEFAARLGILKALGSLDTHSTANGAENIANKNANRRTDNNAQLKELLFSYLEAQSKTQDSPDHAWLLQREAAHTLTLNNDLEEQEQLRLAKYLDPRARNTAAHPDIELIERSLAGEE